MIVFNYDSTKYLLRFDYRPVLTTYYSNGLKLEAARTQTTALLLDDDPDVQAVIGRASVTHNPADAPSLESARRHALTKLLRDQPDRGFRAAVWSAYWASRERKGAEQPAAASERKTSA